MILTVKGKIIHDTPLGRVKTVFRAIAIDAETTIMGFGSRRETGLNSEYNKEKWEFKSKEQDEGQWRENHFEGWGWGGRSGKY